MRITIPLDERSVVPLFKQLAAGLRDMIARGDLTAGTKLPSSRELSEALGVSRSTVTKAYDVLIRSEFIISQPASGTFVLDQSENSRLDSLPTESAARQKSGCQMPTSAGSAKNATGLVPGMSAVAASAEKATVALKSPQLSDYGERICQSPEVEPSDVELFEALNFSAPHLGQLPVARWTDMLVKASRNRELDQSMYLSSELGHEPLRQALAAYLKRARGVRTIPERIAIFSGTQSALDLVCRIILNPGDEAAVENPGFPGARRTFAAYGATILPIPVDSEGILVEHLFKARPQPKVVYVTPGHHDPTGTVLSGSRRLRLLEWARQSNAWIIEDDFDSEYRYGEKPLPGLQSLDQFDCVIYLSAFWKVMFPLLHMGFVVVPERLLATLKRAKSLSERDFHFIEHAAFTDFINEGHLEKHIRKTKATYAKRRETLIREINRELGTVLSVYPIGAGTHLLVRFHCPRSDQELLALAKKAELPIVSTEAYYLQGAKTGEFLLPFAHLEEESITSGIKRFAVSLH
jgi:GntR family transcriptional regulator/MocR family aminotransferase